MKVEEFKEVFKNRKNSNDIFVVRKNHKIYYCIDLYLRKNNLVFELTTSDDKPLYPTSRIEIFSTHIKNDYDVLFMENEEVIENITLDDISFEENI